MIIVHILQNSKKVNGELVITQRGVSGVGKVQMMSWAEDFGMRKGSPDFQSVIVMDALSAHKGVDVHKKMREYKIEPFILPPQTARFISVCDNPFFSSLKARMTKMDTSTRELKRNAFEKICLEYPPELVRSYFTLYG